MDPNRYRASAVIMSAAAAALALSACADSRGGTIPYNVALGAPDAPRITALESNYRIQPADKLDIKVLKSDELTGDYQVDLSGHISMPLIGEVAAADLTTQQLDDKITEL